MNIPRIEPAGPAGTYELLLRAAEPINELMLRFAGSNRAQHDTTAGAELMYQYMVHNFPEECVEFINALKPYRDPPAYTYENLWIFDDGSIFKFNEDGYPGDAYVDMDMAFANYTYIEDDGAITTYTEDPVYIQLRKHYFVIDPPCTYKSLVRAKI